MSSSDYTNLRRLRHVYYPSFNHNHNTHAHNPGVSYPPVNTPYVSQPNYHNHHHCDHHHCDHTDLSHNHSSDNCNYNHNYNSGHIPNSHYSAHPGGHSGVNSSPTSIVTYPPQPAPSGPIIIQSPAAHQPTYPPPAYPPPYYDYPHAHPHAPPPHSHPVDYFDPCNSPYVNKSSLNITKREYYLLPTFYGSVTVSIDSCQDFRKNMQVLCISDLSSTSYFEGTVYDYDKPSGEITIHQIKNITGDFSKPSKYLISLYAASQEVDALKERIEALYLKVFGIDIGGPDAPDNIGSGGTDDQVEVEDVAIKNLYNYFFNETIANEANYEKSTAYLSNKINNLYVYFFNKDLTTETSFNPNNNNIVLDNLTDRVEQLNLYFFGDKGITINV